MKKPFDKVKGKTLLAAIDGFWNYYKPWKEDCNKYESVFPGTNVGHLLNQTAIQWLYILSEKYGWKKFVQDQMKPHPTTDYPATCAIIFIGNCIKHHKGQYAPNPKYPIDLWDKGFKEFCDLKKSWMQGKNVEPPLTDFTKGNPINLSTVARAKDQMKKEIESAIS